MPRLTKGWIFALLGLSIMLRLEHRYAHPNLYVDTELQWAGAQRWLDGEGLRMWRVAEGTCEATDMPMSIFMPGYALAVAQLSKLGGGVFEAGLWLDALSIISLSICLFLIVSRLLGGFTQVGMLWWLLFWGWAGGPLHPLSSSGLLAFSCMAWAMYMLLRPASVWAMAGAMLCLSLAAWTRFAYVPLLIWPGFLWLMLGFLDQDRRLGLKGLWALISGSILILILIWWKRGQETFIENTSELVFVGNLFKLRPFIWESFLFTGGNVFESLQQKAAGLGYLWRAGAWIFSGCWAVWLWAKYTSDLKSHSLITGISWLIVTCLTLAMLSYLSLNWPPEQWENGQSWTFLQEARYYAPVWVLTLLLSQALIWRSGSSTWIKRVWIGLVLLNVLGMSAQKAVRWLDKRTGTIKTQHSLLDQLESLQNSSPTTTFYFSSEEGTRLPELLGIICYPADCQEHIARDSAKQAVWIYGGQTVPEAMKKRGRWIRLGDGLWSSDMP